MELGTFERQLRLMVLLTQNREYDLDELCVRLDMSRRTVYRYLELFRDIGFEVVKQGQIYRLDKSSPFFREITQLVHFTADEALTLRHVLDSLSDTSVQARRLRQKLERIYDFGILNRIDSDENQAENLQMLYEAIKQHRQVVLEQYSSASSNRTDDRLVEPYLFLNNNNEVRCYEVRSGKNKTFKVARIGHVRLLDLLWDHEEHHTRLFTDLFHFSGEQLYPVRLRLGRLAYNLMKEEYPASERYLKPDADSDHWILEIRVCNYRGIGRFVLGLFEDIEVLESDDFRLYLQEKIQVLTKKFD